MLISKKRFIYLTNGRFLSMNGRFFPFIGSFVME